MSSIVRAVDASWRWRCAQIQSFQSIESSNTASDERALQRHIHGRSVSNFSTVGEPCLIAAPEVPSVWRTFLASGQVFQEEVVVGEVKVSFETGKLARFAAGAVVVRVGETKVLVTVVADHKLDAGKDFLSLQVEYREKQYAQGKISATFMRREGAPKERELLCGRLIDSEKGGDAAKHLRQRHKGGWARP